MEQTGRAQQMRGLRWGAALGALIIALALLTGRGAATPATGAPDNAPGHGTAPTGGQAFEDVPPGSPFYPYVGNIFADGITSGYPCGGPGEPCNPPGNRPYFRPGSDVTRGQMSKFLDLGRRNIAEAVGHTLALTSTGAPALTISTTQNSALIAQSIAPLGDVIHSECTRANEGCRAVTGQAAPGDYAAAFSGGRGSTASASDASSPGLAITASGSNAYGAEIRGQAYRGAYVNTSGDTFYSLYVDAPTLNPTNGTYAGFNTSVRIEGNLVVLGAKVGYVADLMQNADSTALEPGDVVTIVGDSPAVLGQIPVVTVRKAGQGYDPGVVGVVDQVMRVPSPALRAAYQAQEQARRAALDRRAQAEAAAAAAGVAPDLSGIRIPPATISDREGNVDVDPSATQVAPDGYANVVTLGSYKGVKADAAFGPIRAGDLLVSSPHPGYAMKADESRIRPGAVIGKALRPLPDGTGLVPIMVTLK